MINYWQNIIEINKKKKLNYNFSFLTARNNVAGNLECAAIYNSVMYGFSGFYLVFIFLNPRKVSFTRLFSCVVNSEDFAESSEFHATGCEASSLLNNHGQLGPLFVKVKKLNTQP